MSIERELLRKISRKTHCINYDEIEELLAQPEQTEQKPVGFIKYGRSICWTSQARCLKTGDLLYTSPPKREPLGEDEIFNVGYKAGFAIDHVESDDGESTDYGFIDGDGYIDNDLVFKFVRGIEKAHGIGGGV